MLPFETLLIGGQTYSLKSCVFHHGPGFQSGHYNSCCKVASEGGDAWESRDDDWVQSCPPPSQGHWWKSRPDSSMHFAIYARRSGAGATAAGASANMASGDERQDSRDAETAIEVPGIDAGRAVAPPPSSSVERAEEDAWGKRQKGTDGDTDERGGPRRSGRGGEVAPPILLTAERDECESRKRHRGGRGGLESRIARGRKALVAARRGGGGGCSDGPQCAGDCAGDDRGAQGPRCVVNRGPKGKAQTRRGRATREARSEMQSQMATCPRRTRCRRLFLFYQVGGGCGVRRFSPGPRASRGRRRRESATLPDGARGPGRSLATVGKSVGGEHGGRLTRSALRVCRARVAVGGRRRRA